MLKVVSTLILLGSSSAFCSVSYFGLGGGYQTITGVHDSTRENQNFQTNLYGKGPFVSVLGGIGKRLSKVFIGVEIGGQWGNQIGKNSRVFSDSATGDNIYDHLKLQTTFSLHGGLKVGYYLQQLLIYGGVSLIATHFKFISYHYDGESVRKIDKLVLGFQPNIGLNVPLMEKEGISLSIQYGVGIYPKLELIHYPGATEQTIHKIKPYIHTFTCYLIWEI